MKDRLLGIVDEFGLKTLVTLATFQTLVIAVIILILCSLTFIFGIPFQDYSAEQFDDPTPPGHGFLKPKSISLILAISIGILAINKLKRRINIPSDFDFPIVITCIIWGTGLFGGYFVFRFFTQIR